ncbi:alanyl-tRNA synthetase [Chitinophaga sp. S165]|nr:alanyl-tRNA synthetase [Chitinophaga sp. S165]
MEQQTTPPPKNAFVKWIKRIGIWAFIFFLVKGLLWLALGYYLIK